MAAWLGRVIGPAAVIGCASLHLRRSLGFAVIRVHSRKFAAKKSVFIRGKKRVARPRDLTIYRHFRNSPHASCNVFFCPRHKYTGTLFSSATAYPLVISACRRTLR